jgi:LysM repeat protein
MKRLIVTLLAIYFSMPLAFAQSNTEKINHKVAAGQTLFFISKMYNVSISDIRKNNPQIQDDLIIKPDDVLVISVPKKAEVSGAKESYQTHTVETKETLYSISKKYNVSVDEIIRMNNLETPAIQIGQELRVKRLDVNNQAIFTPEKIEKKVEPAVVATPLETPVKKEPEQVKVKDPIVSEVPKNTETAATTDSHLLKLLYDSYESSGNTLKKDKGIANFLQQDDKNVYLALVNGVPAGEVIRVRNLMNNKVVYLKVLGALPAKDASNNVGLKISKAAATDLNVIEERFLAEWSWFEVKSDKKLNTKGMEFSDF